MGQCECLHCTEAEKQYKEISDRKASSVLWSLFYYFDERLAKFGESVVGQHAKKVAILTIIFSILDSLLTEYFVGNNIAIEGNYIPAKFFAAGMNVEMEIIKFILVGFIVAFNYVVATRGYSAYERAGGKLGLSLSYFMFVGVVFWNLFIISLHFIPFIV
jgi:hypothetical protein